MRLLLAIDSHINIQRVIFIVRESKQKNMSAEYTESLLGKSALVTGAAKRIGAAIADKLHADGADIAVHYRGSREEADKLCADLNAKREDSAKSFRADINDCDDISSLLDAVLTWRGGLDILVNNASSFYPTALGQITEEDWLDLMGSNLKGPLFLSQAAAAQLRSTKGTIVNIIDIHAQRPLRDHIVYGSAKAGLAMLTKSLAKELAPSVRVNGVAPGAITWPEDGVTAAVKESIVSQIPLGRTGDPADIANCVLFLVRDATYTSGQIVVIDGGRSLGW